MLIQVSFQKVCEYYNIMSNQKILNILPNLLINHFSKKILDRHCISAIGYGSGVFPQTSQKAATQQNTIDLMLVVNDAKRFHSQMITYKPSDYAGLVSLLGSGYLNFLHDYVFPAHFNHVFIGDVKIKYAVIDCQQLILDLSTWNLLTFAGRLHKPVLFNILKRPQPQYLLSAIKNNHKMALNVAILKMLGKVKQKEPVQLQKLYRTISNISYAGDIRHTVAVQNVNKVDNIVKNNKTHFDRIYVPLIKQLAANLHPGTLKVQEGNGSFQIKYTPQIISKIVQSGSIPNVLLEQLKDMPAGGKQYRSLTEKLLMNGAIYIPKQIQGRLAKINKRSSMRMAAQNFLGASPLNNLNYLLAKINKKQIK